MSTELYIFGGPMKLHLTFLGVDRQTLKTDRRFNSLSYKNETDNFNQPHYHLHNSWKINDRTTLFNTLYFIRGEGFFEQRYIDTLYADFNIDTSAAGGNLRGDLVVRQVVSKYQLGLNPRLEIKHKRGTHSVGGSIYFFESDHWGEVTKGNNLSLLTSSDLKYYQYYGKKIVASFYGEEFYHLNDKLSLQATAQLRYQRYSFDQDKIGLFRGFDYQLSWLFFSPRLGFNYQLINDSNKRLNIYTNIALASRSPTDAAVYDASNRYVFPSIELTTLVGNSGDTVYNFGKPLFESEQVFDIELGGNYHTKKYSAGLNFYWMNFSDEIIPYGGINPSNGQLTTVNASGSYRTGVEIQGSYQTSDDFKIDANFSYNRYRIKDFTGTLPVYDASFNYLGDTIVAFENVTGLAFPELLGNLIFDYQHDPLRLTYRFRLVGEQQLELANLDSLAIGAFSESALTASYTFKNFLTMGNLTLTGVVNNLFDNKHEVSGYGWNYGTAAGAGAPITITGGAEYYVASERSWFGQLKLTLF
ncbi:MAG: TonB-dependent receptor [candidate division Zixibacteria bacterium]|nr:TonB-dependent receptor [candidate division Zixibacteria bacterium]